MNKKNIVKSSIILGISGIVAKALGLLFRIPLIYLIGEEGIGLYQLTYPLYTFLLGISSGIPTAISKMISERMALNKTKEAKRVFDTAFVMLAVFGGVSSICLIVFADKIINVCGWSKYSYYCILGISLAPFFTCIMSSLKGYFQGLQYMTLPAVSQIVEQLLRVFVGIGLAYLLLPYGKHVSAGGASFGAAAGSAVAFFLLLSFFNKYKLKYNENQKVSSYFSIFFQIIKIAVPISVAQALGSLMSLIDSMIVPKLLIRSGLSYQIATTLYGQLTGKAFVLASIPLTLSIAISQSTVPAVSESYALNDRMGLKRNIQMAYKISMLIALPSCGGLFILARPITLFIFKGMGDGWQLLRILSLASILIIIAQTSTSVLNGIGKTMIPVLALIAGCTAKVMICETFIPVFGIKAAAYSTFIAYAVMAFFDFIMVKLITKVKIGFYKTILAPLLCTILMLIVVVFIYGYVYNLICSNAAAVILSILSGIGVYAISVLICGIISIADIKSVTQR